MALLPLAFALRHATCIRHAIGKACAQNLAMRLQNGLEAHTGFQEDLPRSPLASIACKQSTDIGTTLCLVTTNFYSYNPSPLYRSDFQVAGLGSTLKASTSPSYLDSYSQSYQRHPSAQTSRDVYLGLGKCCPPTSRSSIEHQDSHAPA